LPQIEKRTMDSILKEPSKMGRKRSRPLRVQRTTLIDVNELGRLDKYLATQIFEGTSMADVINDALKAHLDKLKVE
jgi:hypothetical protein